MDGRDVCWWCLRGWMRENVAQMYLLVVTAVVHHSFGLERKSKVNSLTLQRRGGGTGCCCWFVSPSNFDRLFSFVFSRQFITTTHIVYNKLSYTLAKENIEFPFHLFPRLEVVIIIIILHLWFSSVTTVLFLLLLYANQDLPIASWLQDVHKVAPSRRSKPSGIK